MARNRSSVYENPGDTVAVVWMEIAIGCEPDADDPGEHGGTASAAACEGIHDGCFNVGALVAGSCVNSGRRMVHSIEFVNSLPFPIYRDRRNATNLLLLKMVIASIGVSSDIGRRVP